MVKGILVAQQIFFKEKIKLESRVSSKESGSKTLSLTGLEKITVTVTSITKIGRVAKEFDDIQVGDYVRIRGRVRTDASVVATRVEVIQSPQDPDLVVLQGPVEAVSKPALVILGITVDTSTISDNNFYGVGGTDKRAEFFQKVQPGDLVKAEGRMGTGGQVVWEGITLQKGS
jgi:hypothetical protein